MRLILNSQFSILNSVTHPPKPTHKMTTMKRLLPIALLALAAAGARADLPFIENDYKKAVAQAKAKDVPLFIEAWAPW
jgi:hypothetical protein